VSRYCHTKGVKLILSSEALVPALLVLEGIGVIAFALSGVLAAVRKRLDVVGVVFVAFVTALGGGTLRDVLLDRQPFFWVAHEEWVWVVIALGLTGSMILRARHFEPTFRAIQWPDAVGLGLFAASGTQIALDSGASPLIATLMGVVTAAVGGILRDVLLNEIPWVVASYQLYAVIAFAGGWLVWALGYLLSPVWAVGISAIVISLARVLAIRFNWQLPNWRRDDHTGAISLP
jgi:uncharacterized membrane protein YeiH